MTNEEVKQILQNLKTQYGVGDEGDPNAIPRYWNHTPGTANDPASVTSTSCNHSNHTHYDDNGNLIVNGLCGCNAYGGAIQCYAFSLYLANVVFGTNFTASVAGQPHGTILDGGWKVCKSLSGEKLEPGDVFRFYSTWGEHSAMVWEVSEDGTSVTVAECWGGSGCKLHWGRVNGNDADSLISNISAGLIFLLKAPKDVTPEEPEEPETVTVTFYDDLIADGADKITERTYTVGQAYNYGYTDPADIFPSAGTRTGYTFDEWWFPTVEGRYGYVGTWDIATSDRTALYAHWTANTYKG